jgi:hypothetical protein
MVHYAQGLYPILFVSTKAKANLFLGSTMPLVPGAWIIVQTSIYICIMRVSICILEKVLTAILCQCVGSR